MVQIGSTVAESTSTLVLPFLSINSDSHRTLDYGAHESVILSCHHLLTSHIAENWLNATLASAVLGSLRVGCLSRDSVSLDVVLSVLHDSSLAAVVHFVAVHKLLLRQNHQLFSCQLLP